MKKIISLLLAILTVCTLALGMSGCGSSEFTGTYMRKNTSRLHYIVCPEGTGTWLHDDEIEGDATLVIESGGKGRYYFTAYDASYYGDNYIIMDGEIDWEVVDEYLYVSGTVYFKDESGKSIELNKQYTLEGKTLVDTESPSIRYTKQ